ncbi:MAG: hypothetical protein U9O41_04695, partial [Candidatus Aerophobetes bacterium]|nr:hypothetical protein [Candidatus Aerophobetes bacterium]
MDTVLLKIKRLFKENSQGAALIMAIVVVSVLFIFTSFLVRRVITNTVMVEKARDEQTSYASAKKGILYAVDRLNNSPGTSPNYDSTDWLDAQNWDKREWNTFDLNKNGENDVCIRIDKNDIPHPDNNDPAFDSANDDDGDSNYITIEAKDLPKKLVTLQGISNYTSPLVKYVRFINSDTTFGNNTFGGSGMIGGEAPFCILGDLTWKGSTTNDVTLTSPNVAKVSGSIVDGGSATVTINGSSPDSGYSYFTPINPGDPDFDTAGGVYFDGEHLPSCYDYSSGSP